jgi:hypothetical protein
MVKQESHWNLLVVTILTLTAFAVYYNVMVWMGIDPIRKSHMTFTPMYSHNMIHMHRPEMHSFTWARYVQPDELFGMWVKGVISDVWGDCVNHMYTKVGLLLSLLVGSNFVPRPKHLGRK